MEIKIALYGRAADRLAAVRILKFFVNFRLDKPAVGDQVDVAAEFGEKTSEREINPTPIRPEHKKIESLSGCGGSRSESDSV